MKLRPYIPRTDFDTIRTWITDERTHALWCANRIPYPMEEEGFHRVLREAAERFGDCPFVAVEDDGTMAGFFCLSLNRRTNEGMLKFVMVQPALRGKGYGKEMLRLAVQYAFYTWKTDAVYLNVFPENGQAVRCYESVGFTEEKTEPAAFRFRDEAWGRRRMTIQKEADPAP